MNDPTLGGLVDSLVNILQRLRPSRIIACRYIFAERSFEAGNSSSNNTVAISLAIVLALKQCPPPCEALFGAAVF